MSLSPSQHQNIMTEYDRIRRKNYLTEQERKEQIYTQIPEIRRIDEEIAHISIQKAKEMLFHRSDDPKSSLHQILYDLSMEKSNLLLAHHFPADYLDPIYDCPLCQDTGYVDHKKCSCFQQKTLHILCRESNLGDLSKAETFAAFRTDYYSDLPQEKEALSPWENIYHILQETHAFIENFDRTPGQNLFIYGSAGVGKTFLSRCIAWELLQRVKSVLYLSAYQFFDQLADYTFRRGEENAQTLPSFLHCDLLIIDDLGTELNNAFINSQLFLCINERILHKKSTIISTNLSLEQISRSYTERVFSRIVQSYTLLHLYGEDIRIKKAFCALDEK